MKFLSQREYDARLKQIQRMNGSRERQRRLREEERKMRIGVKLPPTSKLMAIYLFAMLNVVLIYSMVVMYVLRDLSYLGVLITDIAGQVLTYFVYSNKSVKENTASGIVYETAMRKLDAELSQRNVVDETECVISDDTNIDELNSDCVVNIENADEGVG